MKRAAGVVAFLGAATVLGAWIYSHVKPSHFGVCHTVALYMGPKASVTDCEPYAAPEFVAPLAVVVAVVLFMLYLSGDNVEFSLGGAKVKLTHNEKEAVASLVAVQQLPPLSADIDERADAYLDSLPGPATIDPPTGR